MFFSLFSTLVIARGGLKATEAWNFIHSHRYTIQEFQPTHVVLHVGFCDMVPKLLQDSVIPMDIVIDCIGNAKDLLLSLAPAAYMIFSEPLPHCIAHDPQYKIWNKRWRSYNKLVRQMRYKDLGLDIIRHDRLWLSYCSAKPDLYNLKEYFYGLHLNQEGCKIFTEDIVKFVFI